MSRPNRSAEIDAALLAEVSQHPADLVRVVADEIGISRAAVAARARVLIEDGYLEKSGTTRPTYRLGRNRRGSFEHALEGLAEDRVWSRDVAPLLAGLSRNVIDICHRGLTEMVNNAIDHSEGRFLRVFVDRIGEHVVLMVADDGVGIFRKITRALELADERLALLELSKGKLTTDPAKHSGEGIFFTSRMFDVFSIESGGLMFDHDDAESRDVLAEIDLPDAAIGTAVVMESRRIRPGRRMKCSTSSPAVRTTTLSRRPSCPCVLREWATKISSPARKPNACFSASIASAP